MPDKSLLTTDIAAFYKELEPDVKQTTINWRVHTLVQMGVFNRIGRGKLIIGEGENYTPVISAKLKAIHSKIRKEFPYLKICIWETSALNEFMQHQPGRFYLLAEVEKEAAQSVFFFLQELRYTVFIEPGKDFLEKYSPISKESVIVKPLVTEAPIQNIKGVNTASLEKMLVDIFCDDVIFLAQQGSEMRTIFREALAKYSVNRDRMLRYAGRRGKKDGFRQYINSITNFRQ